MVDFVKVCRVGYALNAKKLRRSQASSTASPPDDGSAATSGAVATSSSSSSSSSSSGGNSNNQSKRKIDGSISRPWRGGGLADILETQPEVGESEAVQFAPWEADKSLAEGTDFQIIIHKLTEDIERTEGSERLQALDRYMRSFPQTIIVDSIESVRKVTSRARCCQTLRKVQQKLGISCPFSQPNFILAEKGQSDAEISDLLRANNIRYPLICKPYEACGTPHSHTMVVIVSEEDLHMVIKPCVIQQYFDHNESFYKVYVIDQDVMVYRRPSLPDLKLRNQNVEDAQHLIDCPPRVHSLVFDSRYSYPTWTDFTRENYSSDSSILSQSPKFAGMKKTTPMQENKGGMSESQKTNIIHPSTTDSNKDTSLSQQTKKMTEECPPNTAIFSLTIDTNNSEATSDKLGDLFRLTAKAIKQEFGLTLFGFDVIIPTAATDASSRDVLVIDVNYFPSYKEVPDFPSRLRKYLWRLVYP